MLAMGTSGLVNWWPRGNQWRGAFSVSKQACGFRLHREAHGEVGIWGLAVFLMVSFAGVYLAFPETVRSVIDLVLPVRDLRAGAAAVRVEPIAGTEPLGIDGAIELARSGMPGTSLGFAFLPTQHDRPFRIGFVRLDQERRAPAVTIFVDPWARRVMEVFDPRQFSVAERILTWQHAMPDRVSAGHGRSWCFLCGLLPLLFVAGTTMWRLKRGRRMSRAGAQDLVLDQVDTARRAGE